MSTMCQGFNRFSVVFLPHFVLAKLATSSIRVKYVEQGMCISCVSHFLSCCKSKHINKLNINIIVSLTCFSMVICGGERIIVEPFSDLKPGWWPQIL